MAFEVIHSLKSRCLIHIMDIGGQDTCTPVEPNLFPSFQGREVFSKSKSNSRRVSAVGSAAFFLCFSSYRLKGQGPQRSLIVAVDALASRGPAAASPVPAFACPIRSISGCICVLKFTFLRFFAISKPVFFLRFFASEIIAKISTGIP